MKRINCYIKGQHHAPAQAQTIVSINPATGDALYDLAIAESESVELAVRAARKAYLAWSHTPPNDRADILRQTATLLRQNNQELAYLESLDTGKPIQETLEVDVFSGAECLEYYANLACNIPGHHLPQANAFVYTRREPLGVCLGIGAWNYPIQIACWKSAPALAFGNTMIFKPSELASMTALKLAEIYREAGLPEGVFNIVTGNHLTGELLTRHAGIDKVSFTGSVATGKKVMKAAANTLKKVTLELGGKSPLIVFDDADLNQAVSAAMMANFYSNGEICSNGTRVFVHDDIHDDFLSTLKARIAKLKVGVPQDPSTHLGPLISKAQFNKVMSYIDKGLSEGARLEIGGQALCEGELAKGFYIEPTVFSQCQDNMSIVQEEIFGPVMSVLKFSDEQEVITRANNTHFGLAAGVFSQDMKRAHRVINQLQAGTCWINNYNLTPIDMPFGGYKQSGLGRENGLAGIEQYTQVKSVYVELGELDCPYP